MKKIVLLVMMGAFFGLTGCDKTDALPPKDGMSTARYILPTPGLLTDVDRQVIKEREEEYNNAIK